MLAQTHRPLEVIVVDDGSTDHTLDIVRAHGGEVILVTGENQKVCAARNRGFELSRGDFVCFLDHDDHWFPWKVQRQLEAFAAHPDAGVVFTAFRSWAPIDGTYPEATLLAPDDDGTPPINPEYSGWVYHQFLLDCWALTSTTMIRREVFVASARFDTALPYSEDWDLWLRLSREHRFLMLDRVSTLYRQHPSQGSRAVRDIDYRTRILLSARKRWGLASADGRRLSARSFDRNIARYHMQFGLQHLRFGDRRLGLRSLGLAWKSHPTRWKYAALLLAAWGGWTPSL